MIDPPFVATMAMEPFGVLCVTPDDARLFTGHQWLSARGGMAAHYSDVQSGRTRIVDHFRFTPRHQPGFERGEFGRRFMALDMNAIFLIHHCATGWVDARYLRRIFDHNDVDRIQDAISILWYVQQGKPLPAWLIEAAREL